MTAERTPIRRRLAIGRTAHRPPWGVRKTGHRSIVAPLAATLAATLAVRAGIALARAARERRAVEQREQDRRFARQAGEPLAQALQRMALGQLEIAIELLASGGESDSPETAVHETRKALKRLRALTALARAAASRGGVRTRAGDAPRERGQARGRTRRGRAARHPRSTDRAPSTQARRARRGVAIARAPVERARSAPRRATLGDPSIRAEVLAELGACRVRVSAWQLAEHEGIGLVQPGLARLYRQGQARYRGVTRRRGDRTLRNTPLAQTRQGSALRRTDALARGGTGSTGARKAQARPAQVGAGTQGCDLAAPRGTPCRPARRTPRR